MLQAILGIDDQKLIFHQRKLVPKIFPVNSFLLFFINLRNKINLYFSIVIWYLHIRLKARPDPYNHDPYNPLG
jgi:hypothetical protein